jgi:hypothetical protein
MTEIAHRTVEAEAQYIIDKPDRARAQLAQLAAAGRLEAKAPARPFGDRGEVLIPIWVTPKTQRAPASNGRTAAIAAGASAGVVTAGGLVWVAVLLAEAVAANLAEVVGIIAIVLLLSGGAAKACHTVVTVRHWH